MHDQVEALKANGVKAAYLNSSQGAKEVATVLEQIKNQELKLVYISPEKLFSGSTINELSSWNISLIAIDEAHCISFWGHDFRPEYTKLGRLREILPGRPLIALTATADPAIRRDILSQLSIDETSTFLASFDRPNLHLSVLPGQKRFEKLLDFLRERRDQSGIIYCLSRAGTEDLSEKLTQAGFVAASYHAGMPSEQRQRVQNAFLRDDINIMCATIAFGMGIDKSNVRFVVHWNLSKNLEGFYQEIGRAGRDGLPADTLLFYSYADVAQQLNFIEDASPERRELMGAKLDRMKQYAEARLCRRRILLGYFGETLHENCGHCDVCENPPQTFDGTIIAQKLLSAVFRTREKATLRHCALILRASQSNEIIDRSWHELKTFGAGLEVKFEEWMDYGAQVINAGFLGVAYDKGMSLHLTDLSGPVLKGETTVPLVKFVSFEEKKTLKAQPKVLAQASPDSDLFEKLKAVRKKIAVEHEVPAFVVFSDKSLKDMAAKIPTTETEFKSVHGVGEAKAESYGPIFLAAIREWLESSK